MSSRGEQMLDNVASFLDRWGVEYERQHFGEAEHFDPVLSLPVGHQEAIEVLAVVPEEHNVRIAFYQVVYRAWDDSHGLSAEEVLADWQQFFNAAWSAKQHARRIQHHDHLCSLRDPEGETDGS